ncbi:prolyl 4-hydroxylase subunit alpha-1 [Drosophila persimilis]|uniref:prolyl 4-hydroxylase subunit alpha-1 n=1 Tax=Drosophila persimilis TaxID=7234 RepID=UPI000F093B99|nr:prolyl 4-hydroxylase subunit alpha-1 [Drosophila persimilis]
MVKLCLFFLFLMAAVCLQAGAQLQYEAKSHDITISLESLLPMIKLKEAYVNNFKSYEEALKIHLKQVHLAIKHAEDLLSALTAKPGHNLWHQFRLIRHMYWDWPQYFKLMQKVLGSKEIAMSQSRLHEQPTGIDFEEALGAIYKLQTVYSLDPGDMAGGILRGKRYSRKKWGPSECFMFGLVNLYIKHYETAEYWLELALFYYDAHRNQKQFDTMVMKYITILEMLVEATKGFGRFSASIEHAHEVLSIQPDNQYMLKQLSKLQLLESQPFKRSQPEEDVLHLHNLKTLCAMSYPRKVNDVHCRYLRSTPFLQLAPIRQENLDNEAHVYLYHDLFNHEEIEALKSLARPRLKRQKISSNFTCKIAQLSNSAQDIIRTVNRRIQDVSGMDMNEKEVLQVVNYGIAGRYDLDDSAGSAATALIFMSNVQQGGETVFPFLSLRVKPQKGSLLLWRNTDWSVLHNSCPLIIGNMWVATKKLN